MISKNHRAIHRLQTTSATARAALSSSFGDVAPPRGDVDPVSVSGVIALVESLLSSGGAFDEISGESSQDWRRAAAHLRVWSDLATRTTASAEAAVSAFLLAEANFRATLGNTLPREAIEPAPPIAQLPPLATPPTPRPATSFRDFDPREPVAPDVKPDVV